MVVARGTGRKDYSQTVDKVYQTTSMSISGWFEMANPIPPSTPMTDFRTSITAYSFFDGVNTHTNANSGISANPGSSSFATDASGNITNWQLFTGSPVPASLGIPVSVILTSLIGDNGVSGTCAGLDHCTLVLV